MIGGQRLYFLDGAHNHLGHRSVQVVPARMIALTNGFRQFGVGNSRAIKLPLEDNKNGIAIPGSMLLCVRPIRQAHKLLPESMCL